MNDDKNKILPRELNESCFEMLVHLLTIAIDGIDSGGVRDIPSILVFMHVSSTIYKITPEKEKQYLRVCIPTKTG
jgi:hypothetical protein